MADIEFPAFCVNDPATAFRFIPPTTPAEWVTYKKAVEAAAAYTNKRSNENLETAAIFGVGHQLTVLRRRFMPFYLNPARINGLPHERLHDGIIDADGDGGVTVYRPYRRCGLPDIHDLRNVMDDLWHMLSKALHPFDVKLIECAIIAGMGHYNSISGTRYTRDRIKKRSGVR